MFNILWIGIAFALGLVANSLRLPPMIGYLGAGFLLKYFGIDSFPGLNEFSELGISLLLFSIGLKLDLKSLGKKEVLGVALTQGLVSHIVLFGTTLLFLGTAQWATSAIIAFALTFSSTIFVFKILEDRGDFATLYGTNAIGVLVMQDIIAVLFMAFNANKIPSAWLLLLLVMLWPLRIILSYILKRLNHSELLVLFGLTVAVGGAYLFDLVNVKADLGALILGLMLSKHERSAELNRCLISFKDFFLLGFFLSVGMIGLPTWHNVALALGFSLFMPLRFLIYYFLFTRSKIRSRNSFLSSLGLSNYSEFGLIVISFAVGRDFLGESWLTTMSLTLAFSFVMSAIFNRYGERLFRKYSDRLTKLEHKDLPPREKNISLKDYNIIVIGMGRVGLGAYKSLVEKKEWNPIGFDISEDEIEILREQELDIMLADATSPEFWEKMKIGSIKQILLAMPVTQQNIQAARIIRKKGFKGSIASVAKYPNDEESLLEAGVNKAFNLYAEAGTGLAESACSDD